MTAPSQGSFPADRNRAANRPRRPKSSRSRLRRAALESLEPRTLLAVVPTPTVNNAFVDIDVTTSVRAWLGGGSGAIGRLAPIDEANFDFVLAVRIQAPG